MCIRDSHSRDHRSTAAPATVLGRHGDLLGDRRFLVPHLEGAGGDERRGIFGVGPRTVVVPYFVEPRWLLEEALRGREAPRTKVFLRAAAQKGFRDRSQVARAFRSMVVVGAEASVAFSCIEASARVEWQPPRLTCSKPRSLK